MGELSEQRSRRMWRAVEPIHAVTYFAAESQQACDELGTRGYWASYFALRAAPLGAASAELVTALFYTFHPSLVAAAVPEVWSVATPERFVLARLEAVDAALRRLWGADVVGSAEVAEAAAIAREAALAASVSGRALAAAASALAWPLQPHLVLWHAQTLLREHRGDGHVAALLAAGLDPGETARLFVADRGMDAEGMRKRKGWPVADWEAATRRLVEGGLLDADGGPTARGRLLLAEIEARTDALAAAPWAAVGEARAERLVELAAPLVRAILDGAAFRHGNPMGLVPLVPAG